jgi:hypothetical protein
MVVIQNNQKPESTLKIKSNSICYHFIRESVAMREALTCHIKSDENDADICTKILPGGRKETMLSDVFSIFMEIRMKRNLSRNSPRPTGFCGFLTFPYQFFCALVKYWLFLHVRRCNYHIACVNIEYHIEGTDKTWKLSPESRVPRP